MSKAPDWLTWVRLTQRVWRVIPNREEGKMPRVVDLLDCSKEDYDAAVAQAQAAGECES